MFSLDIIILQNNQPNQANDAMCMSGFIFPVLVAALVPIRSFLVARCFSDADLNYLDPIGETEDEQHDERALYYERRPSVDDAEVTANAPGFSDFHAAGMQHDIEEKKIRDNIDGSLTKRHQAATATENQV